MARPVSAGVPIRLGAPLLSAPLWTALLLSTAVVGLAACGGDEPPPSSGERAARAPRAPTSPSSRDREAPARLPPVSPVRALAGAPSPSFALPERMDRLGVRALGVALVVDAEVSETWTLRREPAQPGDRRSSSADALVALPADALFPAGEAGSPLASALFGFGVLRWAAEEGFAPEDELSRLEPRPAIGSGPRAPSLAELLAHTAGLPDTPAPSGVRPEQALAELERRHGGRLAPVDRPGRRHRFSPAGALLVRQILLTRRPDPDAALEQLLIEPWGLEATVVSELPREERAAATEVLGFPRGTRAAWPSSDLWTTATDLGRVVGGLLASARGLEPGAPLPFPLARRALEPGPGGWGWGVRVIEPGPRFEVGAEGPDHAVLMVGFESLQEGAAVTAVGDRAGWLAREVVRGLAERRGWPGFELEEVGASAPEATARSLLGRYRFDDGTELEIGRDGDGALTARAPAGVLGPAPLDERIHPRTPLVWVFLERAGELEFVRAPGQGVRGLIVGERRARRVEPVAAP